MRLTITTLSAILALGTAPVLVTPAAAQESSNEVAKDGSCPTGFKASGNYCIGDKGDYAEVRSGSCPSGLKSSRKYCIK